MSDPAEKLSTAALERKRRSVADRLLRLERMIAGELAKIDEAKDELREISEATGAGFTEDFGALGSVEVKAGREKELTGTSPELVVATYLGLTKARQTKLVEDGIVEIAEVCKKGARPSVTVRL